MPVSVATTLNVNGPDAGALMYGWNVYVEIELILNPVSVLITVAVFVL